MVGKRPAGSFARRPPAPASVRGASCALWGPWPAPVFYGADPVAGRRPVAISLALLLVSTAGVLGLLVSQYGYAWFLGAITGDMVLLALLSDPLTALTWASTARPRS